MRKRIRTALFCCLAVVDLGLLALVPASARLLNPAPAGLRFSAPQTIPSGIPRPEQNDACDGNHVRNVWCEGQYTRQI